MAPKIITLMTDFGCEDGFVAEMKGVLLSCLPDARIVDVTHTIPAFDIWQAAHVINRVFHRFPAGTVHVGVVDPGVGGARKTIILEASRHVFVGPDNGIFSLVAKTGYRGYEIRPLPARIGPTFHGRDLFAPIAAKLAAGSTPSKLGKKLENITLLKDLDPVPTGPAEWRGRVASIDHFGNVTTNFSGTMLKRLESPAVRIRGRRISTVIRTFSEGRIGHLYFLENSEGFLEIVEPLGSAQRRLRCHPGDRVDLVNRVPAGK